MFKIVRQRELKDFRSQLRESTVMKILLVAALLVSGDYSGASDLPAVHPSISKDLPRVDPQNYWFSRSGSWLAIYPNDTSTLRLYYSYWSGGWDQANWINIRFLRDGKTIESRCSASPASFDVADKSTGQNEARIILSGERDLLIESSGLGIQLSPVQKEYNFEKLVQEDERTWSTRWREWTVQLVIVDGRFADLKNGRWEVIPKQGNCRVAIRIFKDPPAVLPKDWEKVEADALQNWRRFDQKMPSVPQRYRFEAEQAWLNTWYATAPAVPPSFPTEHVLMAKAYMNSLWPWDCCFNALALGVTDLNAGIDQLLLPFALQKEDGQLPDKTGPEDAFFGCTKPPVQGWALGKLMDMHRIPNAELETIYPRLVKWTDFWFTKRDRNGNGIPGYSGENAGWDSGWDNSTVSGGESDNEAPELQAYLILQMKTLARIASQLGRADEAARWRDRAAAHLKLFRQTYWLDGRLVTRLDGGQRIVHQPTSLEPMMSLVLGENLDVEMFNGMVKQLDNYLTQYGLASEMPSSPLYRSDPDAYWSGPIWAPAMYLVIDGLNRGGRRDLAIDLAQRFDRLIRQAGGYYENFDAKTGKGLKTKAYTWTSSVHLLLLHEYGAEFK
jgi:putative isomerase